MQMLVFCGFLFLEDGWGKFLWVGISIDLDNKRLFSLLANVEMDAFARLGASRLHVAFPMLF